MQICERLLFSAAVHSTQAQRWSLHKGRHSHGQAGQDLLRHLYACAGATSKAIQERNPWLTTNLSVLASVVAIVIGAIVLVSL